MTKKNGSNYDFQILLTFELKMYFDSDKKLINNKQNIIMKKYKYGIILGFVAGLIDIIPMIIQNLTWDANISALTMWTVVGFLNSTVDLKINSIIKGILIAFLVLLPSAVLIGWKEPISLIPISLMTIILGGLLGFSIQNISNKQTK
jgi:hypothetical protein